MDEHGMENEHSDYKNSSNTEYLPTKCRVTKPPPPKPATNPLQFIKVAPPPLFQKAKEQISKVEKIKKERKEIEDEAEDWQANLDNWKSSRRKLQEHIIERVVEVKKFEQEDNGRTRRKSKTFSEILEERGKSKYSIPIYIDESNDWSDFGISDLKTKNNNQDHRNFDRSNVETENEHSNNEFLTKSNDVGTSGNEPNSVTSKMDVKYNNNNYNYFYSNTQPEKKFSQSIPTSNGQYTYEGAIEGYRSRIKSRIDDSILVKICDMPKKSSEVASIVPKGGIIKKKELFDKQNTDCNNVPNNTAARVLQDFENSISIKQRLKSLEKCTDQTVKYVDNINIKPKVKQISQLFDKPCTDNIKNNYNDDVTHNNNSEHQRREKLNINIIPWKERENTSGSPDIYMYMDKNELKEAESQSDDKSSDTFYSGMEDPNYPPSISSTDYMALSSDREDSGIHTADVSCSVSQADDTTEELESNTNSNETANDDFHVRQKYYRDTDDSNSSFDNHMLTIRENVTNQLTAESQEHCDDINYTPSYEFSRDILLKTEEFVENMKQHTSQDMVPILLGTEIRKNETLVDMGRASESSPEIKEEILKSVNISKGDLADRTNFNTDIFNIAQPFSSEMNSEGYMFDIEFPLLSTKLVEPPKVKPPPPPVQDDEKTLDTNVKRINSTKRIKNEIILKRSSFLGLNEPNNIDVETSDYIATPKEEQSKVEEVLAKQLYESGISDYGRLENQDFDSKVQVEKEVCIEVPENITEKPDKKCISTEEDEITKREREIIEMVEKAEKFRDYDMRTEGKAPIPVLKPPVPLTRIIPVKKLIEKPADASYYDKQPDYLDDQDSEVLKVEQELQQLEQEELKRKRDNLLFRQACSRAFSKNKRFSLENIFDNPSVALECRKSMPELQSLKADNESTLKQDMFRSIHDIDLKYRKSVPNIPEYLYPGFNHPSRNEFQTIEKYERKSMPEFQHDVHRSAFEVPVRKPTLSYESIGGSPKPVPNNKYAHSCEPLIHNKPMTFISAGGEPPPLVKPRNRHALNSTWLKTRPNIETKSYDQHWLYQEAELRRLQDQKNYPGWQQTKHISEPVVPNFIQRGPITPSHGSSKSSIRKLASIDNDVQPYLEHHPPIGQSITQPRSVAVEEGQNRILSVSGKKKCSFCDHELGRGAAMIIETLSLFYHMECFKCCVCHVQLGNGLNGTDVRVRNQKLHCHNCYSSDDGVKFSCV